ncbi:DNA polymerase III subunit beta [Spirochaeta africana]|uniref:Beta sliding clamp n=1 Tax=Spirochaeta africana (strain ATCC 700263 / DSM 8902 / Z-7692) TaxID=889378 RepID=H9UF19_SPIAZ|nr:DNA polymerase III subunit beta [Spirochaeta africana]AFG36112.1 DNA polymerase III, beta subunit [Spirochaeta africana DSM 8902]
MKFTCDRDILIKEITTAQEVISSRNALSILSNVLLHVENNTLTVRATDLKVSFETKLPVDAADAGATTVFCDKFLGILRSMPAGTATFEDQGNGTFYIKNRDGSIDFKLKSIDAEKFPELKTIADDHYFSIPQREFIEMISQTVFAVSDDETRYFMNGVYMEHSDGQLIMVATDGRRLSYISSTQQNEVPDFPGVIIPPKVLNMVRKLASGEGQFLMAVHEKNIFLQFENLHLTSTLIDGQFPNYRRVIPESQDHSIIVQSRDFEEAIKRVSLLVEKSHRIYIDINGDVLTVRSEESEFGVAKETIPCEYQGPDTTLALNYRYLVDPLRVIDSEQIEIQYTAPGKALTLYSVPHDRYKHIVMPMQLD